MNIKQLRYVTSILAMGSFSSAAAREGVSVQAVSKAMSELEGEVGEPLFNRTSSGVSPTPLGRAFGLRAGKVLKEFDALERFARSRGDEARGLRMGFCAPAFPGIEKFCALIRAVTTRALGRETEVLLTTGETCVEDLRSGRLDALVTIGQLHEPGIVCGSLGTMVPSVIMAETNPLAQKSMLTLEDINTCPVLLSPNFDHFNESVCRAYVRRGMTSELVEARSVEDYADLIQGHNGLSFLVGGEFLGPMPYCVVRPIAPQDRMPIPICLSSLQGADVSYLELQRALSAMKILSA